MPEPADVIACTSSHSSTPAMHLAARAGAQSGSRQAASAQLAQAAGVPSWLAGSESDDGGYGSMPELPAPPGLPVGTAQPEVGWPLWLCSNNTTFVERTGGFQAGFSFTATPTMLYFIRNHLCDLASHNTKEDCLDTFLGHTIMTSRLTLLLSNVGGRWNAWLATIARDISHVRKPLCACTGAVNMGEPATSPWPGGLLPHRKGYNPARVPRVVPLYAPHPHMRNGSCRQPPFSECTPGIHSFEVFGHRDLLQP